MRGNQTDQAAAGRAERETNSKFTGAPRHLQREQAVNPDRRQDETERAEERDENEKETLRYPRFRGGLVERDERVSGQPFVRASERLRRDRLPETLVRPRFRPRKSFHRRQWPASATAATRRCRPLRHRADRRSLSCPRRRRRRCTRDANYRAGRVSPACLTDPVRAKNAARTIRSRCRPAAHRRWSVSAKSRPRNRLCPIVAKYPGAGAAHVGEVNAARLRRLGSFRNAAHQIARRFHRRRRGDRSGTNAGQARVIRSRVLLNRLRCAPRLRIEKSLGQHRVEDDAAFGRKAPRFVNYLSEILREGQAAHEQERRRSRSRRQ